jgi:phage terminase large subunit-like protein
MKRIIVSWTQEESVTLDIPDFELTESEIDKLIEESIKFVGFGWEKEYEWDGNPPKPKGSQKEPPEDFYFETVAGLAATNGHILILKGFELPDDSFVQINHWMKIEKEDSIDNINNLLNGFKQDMPLHPGLFSIKYKSLKGFVDVVGCNKGPGYLIKDGSFVGVILSMTPTNESENAHTFRFN